MTQAAAAPRPQQPDPADAAELKTLHFSVRLGGGRVLVHLSAGAPWAWADLARVVVEQSDALRRLAQGAQAAGDHQLWLRMTDDGFDRGSPVPGAATGTTVTTRA